MCMRAWRSFPMQNGPKPQNQLFHTSLCSVQRTHAYKTHAVLNSLYRKSFFLSCCLALAKVYRASLQVAVLSTDVFGTKPLWWKAKLCLDQLEPQVVTLTYCCTRYSLHQGMHAASYRSVRTIPFAELCACHKVPVCTQLQAPGSFATGYPGIRDSSRKAKRGKADAIFAEGNHLRIRFYVYRLCRSSAASPAILLCSSFFAS